MCKSDEITELHQLDLKAKDKQFIYFIDARLPTGFVPVMKSPYAEYSILGELWKIDGK